MEEGVIANKESPSGWRVRWTARRNAVLGNAGFQRWMAKLPLTRRIARGRARQLFDLLAGFTYTQTLLATVESGVLELLARGPVDVGAIVDTCDLSKEAALRLIRAAVAIDIAQEVAPGWWMLGQQGAALQNNHGALAMIRHHKLLYADLADPLTLLRDDRCAETTLSRFWTYAGLPEQRSANPATAHAYSELMAASQHLVAEQLLPAYDFARHKSLLDVGGGHGAFLGAVAQQYPALRLGLFDLPQVANTALDQPHLAPHKSRIALHPGDFFAQPIPAQYDCITLIRILHDHDDGPARQLLNRIRAALAPGARLLIAEPMAETPGATAMGDAYFGLYLWAMRSGRPRSSEEVGTMLTQAGFARWHKLTVGQPLVTSAIVAFA